MSYAPLLAHIAELKAQASPGPWEASLDEKTWGMNRILVAGGTLSWYVADEIGLDELVGVATFDNTRGNWAANAALAAPAHEMAACVVALVAAEKFRKLSGDQRGCVRQVHGDSHMRCGECHICLGLAALAALAKAWGVEAP